MIRTENLSLRLGDFHLQDISLSIDKNRFFVLMGPTGAGKTVLLEALAGLVPIRGGRILINEKDVTRLPPERRGVGIVYQDYALFPHMSVRDNITYGLRYHRSSRTRAGQRFRELADLLDIEPLLDRTPGTLSGGELQRVALARALVVSPQVILLDEPLSALDPRFREEVRRALKRLHANSEVTFLMVTHDFTEALSLAERAAIMHNGRIEQEGSIQDIFQRPQTHFVADFVGMKNLFPATFAGTTALVSDLEFRLESPPEDHHRTVAIRPEDIVIGSSTDEAAHPNAFTGRVTGIYDLGFIFELHVTVGRTVFRSLITRASLFAMDIREDTAVTLSFETNAVHTL